MPTLRRSSRYAGHRGADAGPSAYDLCPRLLHTSIFGRSTISEPPNADPLLVRAYLDHFETGDDSLLLVFGRDNNITAKESERGLKLTLALIEAASDEALGYIAAGPLEDLLEVPGDTIMDRVEARVRVDQKFRRALSLVACFDDSIPEFFRTSIDRVLWRI